MSKIKLGEWLSDINYYKKNIMDDDNKEDYVPFVINRAMSNFVDTVFWSNEMNRLHTLSKELQYAYYIAVVRKSKRYSKWYKPKKDKQVEIVSEYYDCNIDRAKEIVGLLTDTQVEELEKRLFKGGIK